MSWGTRRRNLILVIIFLLFIIPIGVIAFLVLYKPPTCFDGLQNGEETGIDCGGSCNLLCTNQMAKPIVLWERAFRVTGGLHNVIAYVQNPNPSAFIENVNYIFKIYNEENILISEIEGTTSLLPKSTVPIIETNVQLYEQIVSRVVFEFEGDFIYKKQDPRDSLILIKDERIENEDTIPRVRATVQNVSFTTLNDIDVMAIIYDEFDSVIGISSTFIPRINPEENRDIVFTWQQTFESPVVRIEIIPLYDVK